jgi:hypothetical protein
MITTFDFAKTKIVLPTTLKVEFEQFIERAEEIRIKPILGDDLWVKLENGDYATLKTAVNFAVVYWAYDFYLREGNTKNTALGAMQKQSDYSSNDKFERQTKIDSNIETARFYTDKMIAMLNITDYPEWVDINKTVQKPIFNIIVGDRTYEL